MNLSESIYQHRFDDVKDYLHHRPPYLLVDSVTQIDDASIETSATVDPNAFFIQGHFPGAPILPGAMMQEMMTQSAGILIAANYNPMPVYNTHDPHFNEFALGVLVKVKGARYRGFARPNDSLSIRVTLDERIGQLFDFSGTIYLKEKPICENQFQLMNIQSNLLQGN